MKAWHERLAGHPQLLASAHFSARALTTLRERLVADGSGRLDVFACLAVAGSLGRGEAGPASDVDCVLVAKADASPAAVSAGVEAVLEAVEASGLRPPALHGTFRKAVTAARLLDPAALGALDESPSVFGKRLQLLLDTRAVVHEATYRALRGEVLDWYTRWQPRSEPLALLASELVRYRRSYRAWQTFRFDHGEADSWRLRMAKLASSRLVTVAALLWLIGEALAHEAPVNWLAAHLDQPPLQRLHGVLAHYDGAAAAALLDACESLHAIIESPAQRQRLLDAPPIGLDDLVGALPACGAGVDAPAQALEALLSDFLLARRDDWAPWFYRAMLL